MKMPSAPGNPGASLLLVDDNPHGLLARRTVLEELGYIVYTGANGQEALDVLARHHVDLVITDFRMPSMDGVQLIAHIRESHGDLPIILLSGFVEPLGLTEKSTGADVVLAKSAGEVGFLVRTVRRLLHKQPPKRPAESERGASVNKARNAG